MLKARRNKYTAEEKLEVILAVLSHKSSIKQIAEEKKLAPTMICLWKRQAEDAMKARMQPQPHGRKKSVKNSEKKTASPAIRKELRLARAKATRAEKKLKATQERLTALETSVKEMAAAMGCKLTRTKQKRNKA